MIYFTVLYKPNLLQTICGQTRYSEWTELGTSDEQKGSGARTSGRHRAISGVDKLWTSGETKSGQNKQNEKKIKKVLDNGYITVYNKDAK